ncbi:MAG: SBBP repeat-containing protein, partial [Ignavibacteria bacterium]|nr:SBBP repeat-containing protein [Ignavibacteria bacterium]
KSGNIIITGDGSGASSRDVITIKYNSIGNQIWVANFNSSFNQNDYALAMGIDSQENVYVCGGSQGDLYYDDYLIVKYNSSGVEQWNRRFNGSDNFLDQARKLVIDKSDNVYITGYSTFLGTGYDFTTIKYDLNGNQLWIARYNNGSNDMAEDMAIDEYGNIYVTGISDGNGTSYDYATVKYDSSGNQLWVTRYNYSGEFSDIALALAVDNNGSVFVTGQSNRDFLTIKYSQLTGVIINESIISTEYKLSQNYPNPFNPSTIISFSIRENVKNEMSNVKLIVYDILGNEVATLVNERKNAGSYEVEFDGSNLASGIYIYKLSTGNFSETKRMMLIK